MKKFLTLALAIILSMGALVLTAFAADSATATITDGMVNINDPAEHFISTEIKNLNATTSVEIKLYSGDTHIATTTLKKTEYFQSSTLSVKIIITGESSSWETVWEAGKLSANYVPDKVVLYVDGVEMNSAQIKMIKTSGETPIVWGEVIPPAAEITGGMVDISDPAEYFIATEIKNLNATESVVIKLYSGNTHIATTTLKKTEYFQSALLGVKIIITGESSSWNTVWEDDKLSAAYVPDKVVLYVDGVEMNSAQIKMIKTSGETPINWADVVPTRIVACENNEYGNITASASVPMIGETVYVTVNPAYGYKFVKLVVTAANGEPVEVSGTSFVMPASNVTVSAIYEEAYPTPEKLNLKATVKADELKAREYKFELSYIVDGKTEVIEVAKNDANGNINFATIIFNGAGNYTFYIKQIAGDNASVEYDATVYAINVKVVYTLDGELVATVTGDAAAFTNVAK